jgi:hypothetical protein
MYTNTHTTKTQQKARHNKKKEERSPPKKKREKTHDTCAAAMLLSHFCVLCISEETLTFTAFTVSGEGPVSDTPLSAISIAIMSDSKELSAFIAASQRLFVSDDDDDPTPIGSSASFVTVLLMSLRLKTLCNSAILNTSEQKLTYTVSAQLQDRRQCRRR